MIYFMYFKMTCKFKDGRKLVYLSIGGELSAMFVISYVGDEGMARALHLSLIHI